MVLMYCQLIIHLCVVILAMNEKSWIALAYRALEHPLKALLTAARKDNSTTRLEGVFHLMKDCTFHFQPSSLFVCRYRKVAGDVCHGGEGTVFMYQTLHCPVECMYMIVFIRKHQVAFVFDCLC